MERIMSGLIIAMGLGAAAVGIVTAASRFRISARSLERIESLCISMPEGWGGWFLSGFLQLSAGAKWLRTAILLICWVLAGFILIWLGVGLFLRT